jgi:UDP-N-acetylmuramyl tripeptide synthase
VLLRLAVVVGRLVRALARVRGGGSAIPGVVAQKIDPLFLEHTIGRIPGGVVFITGSNGKSTTTAMAVAVCRAHGLRVFTNPAGSNLPQGLASAVLADARLDGSIEADIAILEVDEAYGPMISARLTPDFFLVTNLQLDQLNRFGEPERVWDMMRTVAQRTTKELIVNDAEPALLALGEGLSSVVTTQTMSVAEHLRTQFPEGLSEASLGDYRGQTTPRSAPDLVLVGRDADSATLEERGGATHTVSLPAPGLHWAIDATLALSLAMRLLGPDWSWPRAIDAFSQLPPVWGRAERVHYSGRDFELLMQKNLPSMQVNLQTLVQAPATVWVAVDEGTPDPSWIYDLALGPITRVDVLSGSKAWQWATFLAYRGVELGEIIEDTREAMDFLAGLGPADTPVTAIVNYEQMMAMRRIAGLRDLETSG